MYVNMPILKCVRFFGKIDVSGCFTFCRLLGLGIRTSARRHASKLIRVLSLSWSLLFTSLQPTVLIDEIISVIVDDYFILTTAYIHSTILPVSSVYHVHCAQNKRNDIVGLDFGDVAFKIQRRVMSLKCLGWLNNFCHVDVFNIITHFFNDQQVINFL